MKLFYLSSLFLCLSFCFSCESASKKESSNDTVSDSTVDSLNRAENDLYKDVMSIHDTLMTQMSNIMTLNKKIKQKAEGNVTGKEKGEIDRLSAELEAANESMMNWMRKFNPNLENMSHEETINYLNAEMAKIQEVKTNMEKAQEDAKDFLNE